MVALADIARAAGPSYLERYGDRVLPSHRRVLRAITACRTPALGGQLYVCACGHRHAVYHSCRNRHCPRCQTGVSGSWLEHQRRLLLPTGYALVTFTLPAGLRRLARSHQRVVYDILIRQAARAILAVCAEPRFLGAKPAILAVLHTWTRDLRYHPHVHLLVSSGGLAEDGETWVWPKRRTYLVPQSALAAEFRRRFRTALERTNLAASLPRSVWTGKKWVANVKLVGSGEKALLYLSRYLFKVAISDSRIESFDGERVTFGWTDSGTGTRQQQTLPVHDFLARYLQHVLPRGFVKVRSYGLWACAARRQLLVARAALDKRTEAIERPPQPLPRDPTPRPVHHPRCPKCGSELRGVPHRIPSNRGPP